jgi:hypothetical protein
MAGYGGMGSLSSHHCTFWEGGRVHQTSYMTYLNIPRTFLDILGQTRDVNVLGITTILAQCTEIYNVHSSTSLYELVYASLMPA